MPTIFSHPAVPLGLAPWFRRLPPSLVAIGAIMSFLPDADVAMFGFGVPYEHPLGHRGITHSISFALIFSAFTAFAYVRLKKQRLSFWLAFTFLFLSLVSHGILDAMTTGGKGVGFFIPFSNERYFLPFTPIRVSPIGAEHFGRSAGAVLASEARWLWLPFGLLATVGSVLKRIQRPGKRIAS
jgi:inner membrane protein